MGVHGLWELLAPVGRRVSVETLAGKKLAIGTPLTSSHTPSDLSPSSCRPMLTGSCFYLCFRCEYLVGTVHEGDARRQG